MAFLCWWLRKLPFNGIHERNFLNLCHHLSLHTCVQLQLHTSTGCHCSRSTDNPYHEQDLVQKSFRRLQRKDINKYIEHVTSCNFKLNWNTEINARNKLTEDWSQRGMEKCQKLFERNKSKLENWLFSLPPYSISSSLLVVDMFDCCSTSEMFSKRSQLVIRCTSIIFYHQYDILLFHNKILL